MKKTFKIAVIVSVILISALLIICLLFKKSTDLSSLKINGFSLGYNINESEDELKTTDNSSEYTVNNLKIRTDKNKDIVSITTTNDMVNLSYNGTVFSNSLAGYKKALGNGYKNRVYDYSQGFKEIVYNDKENNITLEIVYLNTDKGEKINWIILSQK